MVQPPYNPYCRSIPNQDRVSIPSLLMSARRKMPLKKSLSCFHRAATPFVNKSDSGALTSLLLFECRYEGCRKNYDDKRHLKRHYQQRHGELDELTGRRVCKYKDCGISFDDSNSFEEHYLNSHDSKVTSATSTGRLRCGYEGCKERFSNSTTLRKHRKLMCHVQSTEEGATVFPCTYDKGCGFVANTSRSLIAHVNHHKRNHMKKGSMVAKTNNRTAKKIKLRCSTSGEEDEPSPKKRRKVRKKASTTVFLPTPNTDQEILVAERAPRTHPCPEKFSNPSPDVSTCLDFKRTAEEESAAVIVRSIMQRPKPELSIVQHTEVISHSQNTVEEETPEPPVHSVPQEVPKIVTSNPIVPQKTTVWEEPPETLKESDFLSVPKPSIAMTVINPALCPSVLALFVRTPEDVSSVGLLECLAKEPCVLLRNFSEAVGLDLKVFSSKSIVETAPDEVIDTPSQRKQPASDNFVISEKRSQWSFESIRGSMTLAKYGAYQAQEFEEHCQELLKKQFYLSSETNNLSMSKSKRLSNIRFGTNVDLHDQSIWGRQLAELAKLPTFFQIRTPGNMLSYLDHTVLGVNSVQLYMKVPGCRTPGHQENLNFCSINLNVGPGDCEWFCVAYEHWKKIHELCERNNVSYLSGAWWPNLGDLAKAKIPVFRFVQHAGELIWINSGTVHWVHATGFCNNVSWNIGSCTAEQLNMAMERYEWNKLFKYKSIVPMMHLVWNLAAKMTFEAPKDANFLKLVRGILHSSLVFSDKVFVQLDGSGTARIHVKTEEPRYCFGCEEEIFNIEFFDKLAVGNSGTEENVRCYECASKLDASFKTFNVQFKYTTKELIDIYNSCQIKGHGLFVTADVKA